MYHISVLVSEDTCTMYHHYLPATSNNQWPHLPNMSICHDICNSIVESPFPLLYSDSKLNIDYSDHTPWASRVYSLFWDRLGKLEYNMCPNEKKKTCQQRGARTEPQSVWFLFDGTVDLWSNTMPFDIDTSMCSKSTWACPLSTVLKWFLKGMQVSRDVVLVSWLLTVRSSIGNHISSWRMGLWVNQSSRGRDVCLKVEILWCPRDPQAQPPGWNVISYTTVKTPSCIGGVFCQSRGAPPRKNAGFYRLGTCGIMLTTGTKDTTYTTNSCFIAISICVEPSQICCSLV